MKKQKIIIDTDCAYGFFGRDIDDVLAILLALQSPELEVVGITTCFGNIDEKRAYESVRKTLKLAGRTEIPVLHGAVSRADLGKQTEASQFISKTLKANPGEVSLVPIAPLTNLATAERLAPGTLNLALKIVAMGGGIDRSFLPWPIQFELNFFKDPEAARLVVTKANKLVLLPLDLTLQVLFGPAQLKKARTGTTAVGQTLYPYLRSWFKFMSVSRMKLGFPPHDPLTIGYLLHPEWFETRHERLDVKQSFPKRGGLYRSQSGNEVQVCHRVNQARFLDLLLERGLK